MKYIGYIIYSVGVLIASSWFLGIRTSFKRNLGASKLTVNTTMLFIVSLVLIPSLSISPFHLLWLFPASWFLGELSFLFPFSLLSIPGRIVLMVACVGIDLHENVLYKYNLSKNLKHTEAAPSEAVRLIRNHLLSASMPSCFVILSNENTRLLIHSGLEEPLTRLPWPFLLLQRHLAWSCHIREQTKNNEEIFNNTYRYSQLNKAIEIFLKEVRPTDTVYLQD